jgi:fibronectin-binding autotransporter adhesin
MLSTRWGLCVGILGVVLGGSVARAATTCNWQGSGNFNVSGSWSCNHVPGPTDDVLFNKQGSGSNNDCAVTSAVSVNSITITNYGGTVTDTSSTINVTGAFAVSSGAFVVGATGVTIGGALTVSGGSFTSSSTAMQVGGSFTHSGGTFLSNGGTLTLVGTSAAGQITTGGANLSLLTINGGGGTYTLQDDLTSTGALTVTAGTLTAGANNVTIGGALTINGGTFNASSAITSLAGAFTRSSGTFNANGGTFFFNGTSTLTHTFGGAQLADVQVGLGTSGLVGYWKLDENSGSNAADSSGNGNAGTWNSSGVSRTNAVPGTITFTDPRAVTLDGSTGYVTLGVNNFPANDAPQSISLWFKGQPNGNNENFFVMANPVSGSAVQIGYRGNSLIVWNWGGTTLVNTTAPNDTNWHQVVYTFDGATDKLYLDGTLSASVTGTPHQTGTPTAGYLGTYTPNNEMFAGSLDDVRVYTRALTTVEVAILSGGSSPTAVAGNHTFGDAFSCSGSMSIEAGTVTGANALTVGGNWFNIGATNYTDTGLVTLTGTSPAGTITSGGASFGALTVNGGGGSYELENNLSVTGNLTVTAGGLTSANALTVGGNFSNAGAFNVLGAVTLTSASSAATITSGGARFSALTINGTASTVYTVNDRLWVPGGTITLTQGTLAGGSSVIHAGAFSIGSGSFTAGSSTVVFDGNANQSLPFASFSGLRLEDPSESNLVGYWKLDEGQGTWLQDLSGNGNTGSLSSSGVTWATGASIPSVISFDNFAAATFNGSTGYAQLGVTNLPATNGAITISAWVNFASVAGTQDIFALVGSGGANVLQVGLRNGNYGAWPSTTTTSLTGPAASTGAWHHVAYSFDGTSVDTIYVDGVSTTGTFTHDTGGAIVAYLGTSTPNNQMLNGSLDDVRIYNVALTAGQINQLAAGRYAGTGGYATTTLASNTTVGGLLALDAGILNANGKTMSAGATGPTAALVNCGTYAVSNAAQTFSGGLTVQPAGALTLASSGGSVQIGSGWTLTVDGTLNASSTGATIQGVAAASYTFKVGSTSTATPTLNISGLAVKNTAGGMQIGASTSATTTFIRFDNVAFSGGTGAQYLLLNATSLFLSSSGCTFDSGSATGGTTKAVTAAGDGTGNGETRAIFGGTKCATNWALSASDSLCSTAAKSDDDSDNNGVADSATASTNGAIVQFTRAAEDDTAGSVVGFPTAAFNWSTFTYYSTYVAFHNASAGTNDVIYVRDELGNPLYSWTVPTAGEAITGTPQWATLGSTHYVFVATSAGHVYKLIDTATGTTSGTLSPDGTTWATNPYDCACTISTPLALDASNVYFGSTTSNRSFFTVGQASETIPSGSPITITQTVSNNAPAIATIGSTAYAFLGLTGAIIKISAFSQATTFTNTSPGAQSIWGRIVLGTNGSTTRVYAGDDGGTMWAVDAGSNFTTTGGLWKYAISGDQIKSSPYYDQGSDTIQYGTQNGAINVLGGSGAVLNASYPYTPSAGDAITAAPLYYNGVLVVGSTGGKLYFLDRNTGTTPGVSLIRAYNFGASESVSGIGFDPTVNRYMVTTASASSKDGRLYYFDLVTDTTPTFQ